MTSEHLRPLLASPPTLHWLFRLGEHWVICQSARPSDRGSEDGAHDCVEEASGWCSRDRCGRRDPEVGGTYRALEAVNRSLRPAETLVAHLDDVYGTEWAQTRPSKSIYGHTPASGSMEGKPTSGMGQDRSQRFGSGYSGCRSGGESLERFRSALPINKG